MESVTVSHNVDVAASASAFVHLTSAPANGTSSSTFSNQLSIGVNPYNGEDTTGGKGYHAPNTTLDGEDEGNHAEAQSI